MGQWGGFRKFLPLINQLNNKRAKEGKKQQVSSEILVKVLYSIML